MNDDLTARDLSAPDTKLVRAAAPPRVCLMCGADDDPTIEHIIPQALWRRFGIDPDRPTLADYQTILCERHNKATSALHRRPALLDLIETGEPVTKRTLTQLGDWAVWVTLLLGLARGSGVLGETVTRELLLRRFDANAGGTPRGVRVYAARVSEHADASAPPVTSYSLALRGDTRVMLDPRSGEPIGYSVRTGPVNASESIGLGKIALLVVGGSYSSGDDHLARVDEAAASVGLQRILPLDAALPALTPRPVSITDVSRLFTVIPFGSDMSLTPPALRALERSESDDTDDLPTARDLA